MDRKKQLKQYLFNNTLTNIISQTFTSSYRMGIISIILICKSFLLCSLIFKSTWPFNIYDPVDNARTISRKIIATFEKPIIILMCAKEPIMASTPGITYNPNFLILAVGRYHKMEVWALPNDITIKLPGQMNTLSIEAIFQLGNISLVVDVLEKSTKLPYRPNRYLIMPSDCMLRIVSRTQDITGSVLTKLSQSMKDSITFKESTNFTQKNKTTVISRDNQRLQQSIREKLYRPSFLSEVPKTVNMFSSDMDTNLNETEVLAVTAAILNNSPALHIREILFRDKNVNISYKS